MNTSHLDIIIVNWNSGDLLQKCINSISEAKTTITCKIIVIDNASDDDSLSRIPTSNNINVVKNKTNVGFGAACNQGVKLGSSEFVLFLNPDAEVRKDTIEASINLITKNPSITVLGCKQVNGDGVVLRTCARLLTLRNYTYKLIGLSKLLPNIFLGSHMVEWDHKDSREVEHVMGSYYLIKRVDLLDIGLFDETFFVYLEDLDLSRRVIENKGKIFFAADIEIYHETGGTSKQVKAKRLFYSLSSVIVYANKYFTKINYSILCFMVLFIEPSIRILVSLIKVDFTTLNEVITAYKMLYQWFGNKKAPKRQINL